MSGRERVPGLPAVVVLLVLAAAPLAAVTTTAASDGAVEPADLDVVRGVPGRLPPRPAEVTPVPDGDSGAELAVAPAFALLEVAAGEAVQPRLTITNRSDVAVDLDIGVRPLTTGDGGALLPAPDGASGDVPSAAGWTRLAERHVHLEPSERAAVWPTIARPDGGGAAWAAAALVVSADGAEARSVLVAGPAPRPLSGATVRLEREGDDESVAVVTLTSSPDGPAIVSGSLSLRAWYGTTTLDAELPPTIVLPDGSRTHTVVFTPPALPGPYTLELHVGGPDSAPVVASTRVWLWPGAGQLAWTAALLVVLTSVLLVRAIRRRRPHRESSDG